jgi:hypothetical protein
MLKAILPLTTFLIILVSCGNDPKSTKDLSNIDLSTNVLSAAASPF